MQDDDTAFELLDEPVPRSGRRQFFLRSESLVGGLLLLVLACWVGWQWWQQQVALSSYRSGGRYAASGDWDAAQREFLAAGDFVDARARAADAAKKIANRNALYATASGESESGKWAAALRDFRQVQEIQPGFRDSVRLERQAEQQVYSLALSGTVALRDPGTDGSNPPGLYIYLADGWKYMPGSDASSQVRSKSASSCVVYDTPSSSGPEPRLTGRSLMVAQYAGGTLVARPLAFDPAEFGWFTCDDRGVLGRSNSRGSSYLDLRLAYTRGIQFYTTAYQSYQSEAVTRFPLPGPSWAILTDNSQMRQVVGDYSNVLGYSPETRLYTSTPGEQLLQVAERQAIVQAAWLSPDGRFMLSDEFTASGAGPEEHRLVLLRTDRSHAPEVLMSTKRRDLLVVGNAWYDASFIESGAFAGKLLIERKTYPDGELRLIDPNDPGKIVWTSDQIDYVDHLHVWSLRGGILLAFNSMASTSLPAEYVSTSGKSTQLALPIEHSACTSDSVWRYVGSGERSRRSHRLCLPESGER